MSPRRLIRRAWWRHVREDYLNPRSPIGWAAVLGVMFSALLGYAVYDYIAGREDQISAQRSFNAALCIALPDTAEAAAQALVDVVVADNLRRGEPSTEVARIRALGVLYAKRARERALENLPQCERLEPHDKETP